MDHPYRLVILGLDSAWAGEIERRMRDALKAVVGKPDAVEFTRELEPDVGDRAAARPYTVVAYLADVPSRDDANLNTALESARDRMLPILPVTHQQAGISALLPEIVQPLNAHVWDGSENRAVQALLRLFGLIEQERRLFLSYARKETTPLALQLRARLGERGYDVFLDRFSVPPADDFQKRLTIELADKAFVLLLESPAAVESKWVQHEVSFAINNTIALLALTVPDSGREFATLDNAFRCRLKRADFTQRRQLRAPELARVLDEIEARCARQLRLRRSDMLESVGIWLDKAGVKFTGTQDEWSVAAEWPRSKRTVFLVTPRAPAPNDLHRLDGLRERHKAAGGCLVYAAKVRDPGDERLLKWIVGRRPLRTSLHERVPKLLATQR